MRRHFSLLACALLLVSTAHALVLDTKLTNAAQEHTAQELFHAMRCMVCEGQSLAESDALFAQQMRQEIRRMLLDGADANAVRAYFTTRYGDQILLTPPLMPTTYLLWAMPLLLIMIAAAWLWPRRKGGTA